MNELQVKTIELKPAVVEFNHEEIEKELQESLAKYKGLTFTEESTTELRSTLAYLRKGKKAVDDYRKETKKVLTASVNEFENKCKDLTGQFDNVINPLDKQLKDFVEAERQEKLEKIQEIRLNLIAEHELDNQYVDRVEIIDQFLNKGTSLKVVEESLEFKIKQLKFEQDKLKADKEIIETTVRLANAEYDLVLSTEAYVRLLEFENIDSVKSQIENDAKKEVNKRIEAERLEKERIEKEKQDELERQERERIEQESKQKPVEDPAQTEIIKPVYTEPIELEELPFTSLENPFEVDFNVRREYEVFATEEQLELLQKFMDENGIEWGVFDD